MQSLAQTIAIILNHTGQCAHQIYPHYDAVPKIPNKNVSLSSNTPVFFLPNNNWDCHHNNYP